MSYLKIIVVDDDCNIAKSLSDILVLNGHEVTCSMSARQALEFLDKQPYDCLISDIKMPNMDGIELSRQVKASNHPIPIVLMTAYATQHLLSEIIGIGVDKVVLKPVEIESLLGYLAEL